jgi:hypothetical protein
MFTELVGIPALPLIMGRVFIILASKAEEASAAEERLPR